MPRFFKQRFLKGTTSRGISAHKVCIELTIDENDNMFLEIIDTSSITSNMVKKSSGSKLDKVMFLITNCKRKN